MSKSIASKNICIAGRYDLEGQIGIGGMGEIHRAFDKKLNRNVAVKLLRKDLRIRNDSEQRFRREAKIGAQLSHPNIVRIYDFGRDHTTLYLVMELLEGVDLAAHIEQEGAMEPAAAIDLALQLSDAMTSAHQMHLLHRDIKPENIFLVSTTPVICKIVDFGMALALDGTADIGRLTEDGRIAGTPTYMAPEQFQGKEPDPASDVYGLACVLFNALTGEAPYQDESLGQLAAHHLFAEVPQIPTSCLGLPDLVRELVWRCMSKHPSRRPTMLQIRDRLLALQTLPGNASSPLVSPEVVPIDEALSISNDAREMRVFPTTALPSELRIAILAAGMALIERAELRAGDLVLSLDQAPELLTPFQSSGLLLVADTNSGDMERISALLRRGTQEVVSRPATPEKLIRKLRRAFRSRRT